MRLSPLSVSKMKREVFTLEFLALKEDLTPQERQVDLVLGAFSSSG